MKLKIRKPPGVRRARLNKSPVFAVLCGWRTKFSVFFLLFRDVSHQFRMTCRSGFIDQRKVRQGEVLRCFQNLCGGGLRRDAPPDGRKSAEPSRYQKHLVFRQGKAG